MEAEAAAIIDNSWRDLVLAHDTQDANEPDIEGTLGRAFAHHMRMLLERPTLDVDLVSHCNLNCACCCHYSPIAKPGFLTAEELERDLSRLARIEEVEGFFNALCLMGGEPLLHPDLAGIVRLVRTRLPQMTIRLVTNGLLLADAANGLWEALAATGTQLLITPYPTGVDYPALVELAGRWGVDAVLGGGLTLSDAGEPYFLQTPMDASGAQDAAEAFVSCPLAGATMQLLDGRIYPCNRGALFGRLNARFGTEFRHEPGDFLELTDIRDTREIDVFRRTKKPMCRHCAPRLAKRIPWGPSTRTAPEWLI